MTNIEKSEVDAEATKKIKRSFKLEATEDGGFVNIKGGTSPTKTFGVKSKESGIELISQLILLGNQKGDNIRKVNSLIAMVADIEPQDNIEAMLATQMSAIHHATMECAANAWLQDQTFEGRELNLNYMTKLSRVFASQVEALNKYRGKGQQKMTVEHVHVNEGGQAIIGNVEQGARGKLKSD